MFCSEERLEDIVHNIGTPIVLIVLLFTSNAPAAEIPIQEFLSLQEMVKSIDLFSRTPPEEAVEQCSYYTELDHMVQNYFTQRRPIYAELLAMDFDISLRVEELEWSSELRPALVKKRNRVRILIAKVVNWDNQVLAFDPSISRVVLCPAI